MKVETLSNILLMVLKKKKLHGCVACGIACGYVISALHADGPGLFISAGNVALFGDMKFIGESFHNR